MVFAVEHIISGVHKNVRICEKASFSLLRNSPEPFNQLHFSILLFTSWARGHELYPRSGISHWHRVRGNQLSMGKLSL